MSEKKVLRFIYAMAIVYFLFIAIWLVVSANHQLHWIDLLLIFSLEIICYGYDLYDNGERKRKKALLNQQIRRVYGVNDFHKCFIV